METGTNTDTQSSYESLLFSRDENHKSPESSDCEGYATPLASSLTDISGVTINLPENDGDSGERRLNSGELTPKIRAASPPVVKQIMFLQKPNILVMTQRELTDEEYNVQKGRDDEESSEEEFYDVADDHIRDVALQLLSAVSKPEDDENAGKKEGERAATPIVAADEEEIERKDVDDVAAIGSNEESGSVTPVVQEEIVEEKVAEGTEDDVSSAVVSDSLEDIDEVVAEVAEALLTGVESVQYTLEHNDDGKEVGNYKSDSEVSGLANEDDAVISAVDDVPGDVSEEHETNVENSTCQAVLETDAIFAEGTNNAAIEIEHEAEIEEVQTVPTIIETDALEAGEEQEKLDAVPPVSEEKTQEPVVNFNLTEETVECADAAEVLEQIAPGVIEPTVENKELSSPQTVENEFVVEAPSGKVEAVTSSSDEISEIAQEVELDVHAAAAEETVSLPTEVPPPSVSQETAVVLPMNPETETMAAETMPTLVISDEVKTSPIAAEDDFSDCSIHEVKVDFDGYSSGKEESLSSSTSSESFEFTETVPSSNSNTEERNQAIRDSINERYPTNGSDDELDSVGEDYDEDLLAVKQISAEVEQLVAAINAFGRDEEQQMSAYLVGKNMAAEKKRKSAMDVVSTTSPFHDQLVQTDNDSFILVDRHLPETMENLQVEIDRLKTDLEKSKIGEKELRNINAKLQDELEESQQTIDGIEVEAEQQYTELTSEIDELCEIVLKKDQELSGLKERVANLNVNEMNLKDDVDAQKVISQRQKEIIEGLREELDAITKKLIDVSKSRDKAIEEATIYKMKNMERERFLSREAQMSMEIEDLQRELNKQKLILNGTSMAKLADTFDRKVLQLENELRERDMLICKQNQIINSHRKSPTGSIITTRKMQPRASVLAAAGNLPSAGSSSESFQNGLDLEAKEALLSFILSDRHNQLANIYNIGRILDLTPHEERAVERHLTKDRFT